MAQAGLTNEQIQLLSRRFPTKHALYKYLDTVLQLFMPRERQCSLQHMQDLLMNRKRYYHKREVSHLKVPIWSELSLERQWQHAILLPNMVDYLPADWMQAPKRRERVFFYSILVTLAPGWIEEVIKDCREQRIGAQA